MLDHEDFKIIAAEVWREFPGACAFAAVILAWFLFFAVLCFLWPDA